MKKESKLTVTEKIVSINQAVEIGDVEMVKHFCKNGGLINAALRSKVWLFFTAHRADLLTSSVGRCC
jgi:hypothetical protein